MPGSTKPSSKRPHLTLRNRSAAINYIEEKLKSKWPKVFQFLSGAWRNGRKQNMRNVQLIICKENTFIFCTSSTGEKLVIFPMGSLAGDPFLIRNSYTFMKFFATYKKCQKSEALIRSLPLVLGP